MNCHAIQICTFFQLPKIDIFGSLHLKNTELDSQEAVRVLKYKYLKTYFACPSTLCLFFFPLASEDGDSFFAIAWYLFSRMIFSVPCHFPFIAFFSA